MKLKTLLPVAIAGIFIIASTSCVSSAAESDNPESIVKVGDVTFKATHLSVGELTRRHGKEDNPYTGRPKGFVFDTIVFELEISSTETTLIFDLTDSTLSIEGNTENADNRTRFMADWETYTINAQEKQIADYYALRHTVNKTMFKNKVTVEPGKPVKGYIAFTGMYPKGLGETTLKILARTTTGDEGVVKIPFILKEQSMKKSLFGIEEKKKDEEEKPKPENSIFD